MGKGYLDLHHFHTGRGNFGFFILPDCTVMLIDATEMGGSSGESQTLHISPAYPDDSRTAASWISGNIRQLTLKGPGLIMHGLPIGRITAKSNHLQKVDID